MEEERTNLVPRLQQDAYLHHTAAARPGERTQRNGFFINVSGSNNYASFNESHNFAQELPTAGIANRYLADSFDCPDISSFDTNAASSAQSYAFSTGALELTNPTHAGYSGVPPATQYCPGPSNYIERPFATHAAFNGTDTFATESTTYTNGSVIANNPLLMPVSNNHFVPQDIEFMNEGPSTLPPNIYNTGQASAYYPFPMHGFNNPNAPTDLGLMTESPITFSPNNYTTSQASAINPLPMPTSNNDLIPVDIGPPISQRPSCPECDQTFSRLSDLERHAKKHQPGPKEFMCHAQGCKYESHRKDKLVEHMRCRHPAAGNHAN